MGGAFTDEEKESIYFPMKAFYQMLFGMSFYNLILLECSLFVIKNYCDGIKNFFFLVAAFPAFALGLLCTMFIFFICGRNKTTREEREAIDKWLPRISFWEF